MCPIGQLCPMELASLCFDLSCFNLTCFALL